MQSSCPKHHQCNAPLCPLETNWQKRKHLDGERVCFYLSEAQKTNAKPNFEGQGLGYLYEVMAMLTPTIIARHYIIKNALEKASKTNSRMARKIGVNHAK
jgi:hypothetical protein